MPIAGAHGTRLRHTYVCKLNERTLERMEYKYLFQKGR